MGLQATDVNLRGSALVTPGVGAHSEHEPGWWAALWWI